MQRETCFFKFNFYFHFQENKNRRQYYYNNFDDESYDIKTYDTSTTSIPSKRNNQPVTKLSNYDKLKSITTTGNDDYANDKTDYNVNEVESDFPTYFPTRVIHSTSNHLDNKVVTNDRHDKNEVSNKNVFATLKVVDNNLDIDKKKKNPEIKGKIYDFYI